MIRLDNIHLTFPDGDARVTAVNHVTLTAHPGTVTGITGPSGSGKTLWANRPSFSSTVYCSSLSWK